MREHQVGNVHSGDEQYHGDGAEEEVLQARMLPTIPSWSERSPPRQCAEVRIRAAAVRPERLLPLQRDFLRTLFQNRTGHFALPVELEFEDGPAGILEARL